MKYAVWIKHQDEGRIRILSDDKTFKQIVGTCVVHGWAFMAEGYAMDGKDIKLKVLLERGLKEDLSELVHQHMERKILETVSP